MNHSEMNKVNRCRVLHLLLEEEGLTRTELAAKASLRKATITNIVNEFLSLGLLAPLEEDQNNIRKQRLRVQTEAVYIMTISINRRDYRICLYALQGVPVQKIRREFGDHRDIFQVVEELKADARTMLYQIGKDRVIRIVLAVPGPYIRLDGNTQTRVSMFDQFSLINLQSELENALEMPVISEHDAKLSAYAEWKNTEEVKSNPKASLIYLGSVGFGVGAGFIIHGKIVSGKHGIAGEIGHMGINFNGRPSEEGHRGTFEYYAGTDSAVRYMRERMYEFPGSALTENSSYGDIVAAYVSGDPLAVCAIHKMAWMLGYGIANLVYILNPDCIVLGVDYPNTEDFIEQVRNSVREQVYPDLMDNFTIRYSCLHDDTVLLGAYYYAVEKMTDENSLVDRIRTAVESRKQEFSSISS